MEHSKYLILFEKYLAGKATKQEIEAIMAYQDDFELAEAEADEPGKAEQKIGRRILSKIDRETGSPIVIKRYFGARWYAAAAILIVFTVGVLLWKVRHDQKLTGQQTALNNKNDIKPGIDKAILTLANGQKIILTDSVNGTVAKQGNILIKKEKNGILHYVVGKSAKTADNAATGFNTFTTPRGAEYHVTLPDGSVVWLNAASSIKFPTTFASNERSVELTGEAYFEVAKDKHKPFKVKFNNQEVEVLGTHFDIMAYADEPQAKTTLLEGSVKISRDQMKQVLVPGQQAVSSTTGKGFTVQKANIQEVMAWKNGYFLFRNVNIVNIMRQASRWYDVDIVYEDGLVEKEYGGRVSKFKNISELLHNLELTGTIHFKVEGRRVTVMQ